MTVVQKHERYGRLRWIRLAVDPHLLLNAPCIKRPQVSSLFYLIILRKTFLKALDVGKILICIKFV